MGPVYSKQAWQTWWMFQKHGTTVNMTITVWFPFISTEARGRTVGFQFFAWIHYADLWYWKWWSWLCIPDHWYISAFSAFLTRFHNTSFPESAYRWHKHAQKLWVIAATVTMIWSCNKLYSPSPRTWSHEDYYNEIRQAKAQYIQCGLWLWPT